MRSTPSPAADLQCAAGTSGRPTWIRRVSRASAWRHETSAIELPFKHPYSAPDVAIQVPSAARDGSRRKTLAAADGQDRGKPTTLAAFGTPQKLVTWRPFFTVAFAGNFGSSARG